MKKLPQAKRYLLRYRKATGEEKIYEISGVIENKDTYFTAYVFGGEGIKSFRYDRVKKMKEVKVVTEMLVN